MSESRVLYVAKEKWANSFHRRRAVVIGSVVALFIVLPAMLLAFLHAPWIQVSSVQTEGADQDIERYLKNTVLTNATGIYAFFLPPRNIFLISTNRIRASLEQKFPSIESSRVVKIYPGTIKVGIKEREFFGIICKAPEDVEQEGNGVSGTYDEVFCGYMDVNGFVYDRSPSSSGHLLKKIITDDPNLAVGRSALDRETVDHLRVLSEELSRTTRSPVSSFRMFHRVPSEIRAESSQGFALITMKDDDVQRVAQVLKTVLEKEIRDERVNLEYIDLRFGNKVFYKYKGINFQSSGDEVK